MGGLRRGTSKITEPGPSVHTPKITQIIIVKYNPGPSDSPGKGSDGFMLCALNPHISFSDLVPSLCVGKSWSRAGCGGSQQKQARVTLVEEGRRGEGEVVFQPGTKILPTISQPWVSRNNKMILGHWSEEERGGQLVTWSIVVTVLRCGRGTRTRLGAPGPMQWIVGAASVVAAAWRAVAPREVTAAAAGAGECWRPGLAVQRAGSQPSSRWWSRPAGEN